MTPDEMQNRLKKAYPDCDLVITDLTGTEDHYEVRIAHGHFRGLSRIEQQRAVMNVFSDVLKTGELHALTIKVLVKE